MARKIAEVPYSDSLPEDNEFVLPIYLDNTSNCLKKISLKKIIEEIKTRVNQDCSILVLEVENGIKFIKE